MEAIKGIYHDGIIELFEKPDIQGTSEVLIIFPQKKKIAASIGGLFKGDIIDYNAVEKDLKTLSRVSEKHILNEFEN